MLLASFLIVNSLSFIPRHRGFDVAQATKQQQAESGKQRQQAKAAAAAESEFGLGLRLGFQLAARSLRLADTAAAFTPKPARI
jgi:hypothetical protein